MKHMRHNETGSLNRVSNHTAAEMYATGEWSYISKSEYAAALIQEQQPQEAAKNVSPPRSKHGHSTHK